MQGLQDTYLDPSKNFQLRRILLFEQFASLRLPSNSPELGVNITIETEQSKLLSIIPIMNDSYSSGHRIFISTSFSFESFVDNSFLPINTHVFLETFRSFRHLQTLTTQSKLCAEVREASKRLESLN